MSDWFTVALEIQREMLRAQQAQIDAAQKLVDAGKQMTAMQEAGRKTAEANLHLWKQWLSMWGWK